MIQIAGSQLNQWDVGRSVSVSVSKATHVHFANQGDSKAVIIEITGGTAKIPNYLLQTGKALIAYEVLDGVTLESKSFAVRKRERPENYVYEDDRRNYIYDLITDALTATAAANQAAENASNAATNAQTAAMDVTKVALEANEAVNNANNAAKSANEAAIKAAHTAKALMVVGGADGTVINLDGAGDQFFVGLRIFGKTTQDGTPTLDAPVELVSVGDAAGKVGLYVAGKNLFANSETHAVDATGAEVNNSAARRTPFIPVKPGQNIAFSKSVALPSSSEPNGMLRMYDKTRRYVSSITALGYAATKNVVTIPNGIYFVRFVQYGFTYVENLKVQMEFAEAATNYDTNPGQSLVISTPTGLCGIQVTSGGDYTDSDGRQWICDERDFTRGVYIQRIGKVVLKGDSSDRYTLNTMYAGAVRFDVKGVTTYPRSDIVLCTHLPAGSIGSDNAEICNIHGLIGYPIIQILARRLESADAMGLEKYLAENPITIYYVLADPIETPLSEEEIAAYRTLHTYRNNTTVSNDAGAYMELEYVMDAKKYIDSLVIGGGSSAAILNATVE